MDHLQLYFFQYILLGKGNYAPRRESMADTGDLRLGDVCTEDLIDLCVLLWHEGCSPSKIAIAVETAVGSERRETVFSTFNLRILGRVRLHLRSTTPTPTSAPYERRLAAVCLCKAAASSRGRVFMPSLTEPSSACSGTTAERLQPLTGGQ